MVGKPWSDQINAQVEILLKCSIPPKQIAEDVNLSISSVYRKKAKLEAFGTVNPAPLQVLGRPRALTREHEITIAEFIEDNPTVFVDEIIAFIWDEYDVQIAESTIKRTFNRIRFLYKRIESIYGV